jgi:DNA-binding CsgD family transcriptional regulator/tetratricopeptide (TPR) repeat protein
MGPLRGRDSERAVLGRLVAAAADGAGGIVIVEGAAGIGKSRLLAEAAQIATSLGVQTAAGACDELDQVTPWAPLLRALSSTAPMLVSTADLAPLRALPDQRLAVIECIRTALERTSHRQPLLITVDDLQWADPATLLALGSLPAQLFSFPVAWILTQRPLLVSPRLQSLIGRLDEAGADRLHLNPLDAEAVAAMTADMLGTLPDSAVADLLAKAEGNPFYIAELLRGTRGTTPPPADADPGRSSPAPLPASLRSAVAGHLRSLPEPAQDVLKVASVLGREFTVSELAAMTGQPVSQLMSPLEQALTAEVITEQADRLAFRHDLVRQAVYQNVPVPLRHGLHRDAATTLLAQGAPIIRAATHLALGAQTGDEQAIAVLTQAISELSPTSATAAADLGLRVLDLTGPEDPRRPGLVATTVGLLGWASRVEEARTLGEGYLRDHPQPAALEAQIHHGMRRAWARSTHAPYPAALPAHLLTDATVPELIRADLIAWQQVGVMWQAPAEDVDQALKEAAKLIADRDDETSRNILRNVRIALADEHGYLVEAMQTAESDPQPAERARPGHTAGQAEGTIAASLRAIGQPREALELLARAQQAAYVSGDMFVVVRCQGIRALALLELGRLDDARAEAHAAAQAAEDLGLMYYLGGALAVLVETSIRQGDLAGANAATDRLVSRCPPNVTTGDHCWASALCADARGRPEAALTALAPVLERLCRNRFYFATWYPGRLTQLTALAMRAGDARQAGVAARAAAELSRRNPGVVSVVAAAIHARGLWQSDVGALHEAVELLTGSEQLLATAAAQEDLASALTRRGEREDAVPLLEAAYDAYHSANAARDLARVRGALHALGVRKRQPSVARPQHGWASLTSGELAVVRVVAEGLTSREAAAQLYLSPDTVNTHLRHAFTKLGIRSRVELARIVLSHPPGS